MELLEGAWWQTLACHCDMDTQEWSSVPLRELDPTVSIPLDLDFIRLDPHKDVLANVLEGGLEIVFDQMMCDGI